MTWPGPWLSPCLLSLQCDRMAADCAHELRRHGVSYVSLWPGLVQTELLRDHLEKSDIGEDLLFKQVGKGRPRVAENARESALHPNVKTVTTARSKCPGADHGSKLWG